MGALGTVGGNVKWCCHFGKHYGDSLKKLKTPICIQVYRCHPFVELITARGKNDPNCSVIECHPEIMI